MDAVEEGYYLKGYNLGVSPALGGIVLDLMQLTPLLPLCPLSASSSLDEAALCCLMETKLFLSFSFLFLSLFFL